MGYGFFSRLRVERELKVALCVCGMMREITERNKKNAYSGLSEALVAVGVSTYNTMFFFFSYFSGSLHSLEVRYLLSHPINTYSTKWGKWIAGVDNFHLRNDFCNYRKKLSSIQVLVDIFSVAFVDIDILE